MSLAGQAASGIFSAINNRRMQRERDAESARQVAEAEGRAYEDPLARSEVQAATNKYDRDAERQIENARNVSTIMGATPEYDAAVQKGVAEGKANLLSGVTENASARKDANLYRAEAARRAHAAQVRSDREARNSTYAALAANAANAFGSIVDSYSADAAAKGNIAKAPANNEVVTPPGKIHNAKSRGEQFQIAADASSSPVEKGVLQTVANAANEQKVATSQPAVSQTTDSNAGFDFAKAAEEERRKRAGGLVFGV